MRTPAPPMSERGNTSAGLQVVGRPLSVRRLTRRRLKARVAASRCGLTSSRVARQSGRWHLPDAVPVRGRPGIRRTSAGRRSFSTVAQMWPKAAQLCARGRQQGSRRSEPGRRRAGNSALVMMSVQAPMNAIGAWRSMRASHARPCACHCQLGRRSWARRVFALGRAYPSHEVSDASAIRSALPSHGPSPASCRPYAGHTQTIRSGAMGHGCKRASMPEGGLSAADELGIRMVRAHPGLLTTAGYAR